MGKTCNCLDCGKPIWKGSKRCKSCAQKGDLNYKWKPDKERIKKEKKEKKIPKLCIDCSKSISQNATRCKSCSRKGHLNHFKGKKHTEESKKKFSDRSKGRWSGDKNPRVANPLIGEDNPNWRGGTSLGVIYPYKFKKKMRPLILETYDCCQWCGTKEKLVVHHIDHNIQNNEFCNLITLCHTCNIQELHEMKHFKFLMFRKITESKYLEISLGYPAFINPYWGSNSELLEFARSRYGKNADPVVNKGKEWGIIKTR